MHKIKGRGFIAALLPDSSPGSMCGAGTVPSLFVQALTEEKQKGLPGPGHRWLPQDSGHVPALAGASEALAPRGPRGFLRGQRGARRVCPSSWSSSRCQAGSGQSWEPQALRQLRLSSASLGAFPAVTAPALEGLPEPEQEQIPSPA